MSCLRLNQRGADGRGEDYYHAGLWQDLDQVLNDPWIERFSAVYLLGYSIGGQLCLHWAAKGHVERSRVRSVAAVCPPLDLSRTASTLDTPARAVYRAHIMRGLRRTYAAVAARRPVPMTEEQASRIRYIREWDEAITAPRFEFHGAEHYYSVASVGPHLSQIRRPSLLVVAEEDPMVPFSTLEPSLSNLPDTVVIKRIARGGHVGFPASTCLDEPGPPGLEPQILSWLRRANPL
jgi:predicted alpha/beta-fold hydrolase